MMAAIGVLTRSPRRVQVESSSAGHIGDIHFRNLRQRRSRRLLADVCDILAFPACRGELKDRHVEKSYRD